MCVRSSEFILPIAVNAHADRADGTEMPQTKQFHIYRIVLARPRAHGNPLDSWNTFAFSLLTQSHFHALLLYHITLVRYMPAQQPFEMNLQLFRCDDSDIRK